MPRKVDKIISLEVSEPNSAWDYRQSKILNNFVCKKSDAENTVQRMDRKDYWRTEKRFVDEVKGILAEPGTRNASNLFFTDEVNIEEVKLPSSVKSSTKYIYKVYGYSGDKLDTEYGVQKDALAFINRRIKTKYVYVTYNGVSEKMEYDQKAVAAILNGLEETTSPFEIEPIGRSGNTEDSICVSIFKNCIK